MNYKITRCDWINGNLWKCSIKVWAVGSCGCTAKTFHADIESETRPGLQEIKKAAII